MEPHQDLVERPDGRLADVDHLRHVSKLRLRRWQQLRHTDAVVDEELIRIVEAYAIAGQLPTIPVEQQGEEEVFVGHIGSLGECQPFGTSKQHLLRLCRSRAPHRRRLLRKVLVDAFGFMIEERSVEARRPQGPRGDARRVGRQDRPHEMTAMHRCEALRFCLLCDPGKGTALPLPPTPIGFRRRSDAIDHCLPASEPGFASKNDLRVTKCERSQVDLVGLRMEPRHTLERFDITREDVALQVVGLRAELVGRRSKSTRRCHDHGLA